VAEAAVTELKGTIMRYPLLSSTTTFFGPTRRSESGRCRKGWCVLVGLASFFWCVGWESGEITQGQMVQPASGKCQVWRNKTCNARREMQDNATLQRGAKCACGRTTKRRGRAETGRDETRRKMQVECGPAYERMVISSKTDTSCVYAVYAGACRCEWRVYTIMMLVPECPD